MIINIIMLMIIHCLIVFFRFLFNTENNKDGDDDDHHLLPAVAVSIRSPDFHISNFLSVEQKILFKNEKLVRGMMDGWIVDVIDGLYLSFFSSMKSDYQALLVVIGLLEI